MKTVPLPTPGLLKSIPWIPITLLLVILGWSWTLHEQVATLAGNIEYVERTQFTGAQGLDLDRQIIFLQAKWSTQEAFNARLQKMLDRINGKLDRTNQKLNRLAPAEDF